MAQSSAIDTSYFSDATNTLKGMLTPFAGQAVAAANGSALGSKSADNYQSRVTAAQTNGGGPEADPINAPWSFDDFALGRSRLTHDRRGSGRRPFPLLKIALLALGAWLLWKWLKK
jgi:hypothetical protein